MILIEKDKDLVQLLLILRLVCAQNNNAMKVDEDIKTSTLDYNGERYLSSIINCVIFRL
jgi:hypothetical protein